MDGTVLVADDDRTIRTVLTQALTRAGCRVHATASLVTLKRWVDEGRGDLLITDVVMPDGNGLAALPEIAAARPDLPVIVISAQNTIMTAIQAAENDVFDYLPKPFDLPDLMRRAARALEQGRASRVRRPGASDPDTVQNGADTGAEEALPLVGRSPAMQALYRLVARVMNTALPVLVVGESGTGKSLIARAIHDFSDRRSEPFVPLAPEDFATEDGPARALARAARGTLLLEAVEDFDAPAQARLTRLLDTLPADGARLIATARADLERRMREGTLREDLYYRLAGVTIAVPPLRARIEDIPALAEHFLARAAAEGLAPRRLDPEAEEVLRAAPWPGNVRQLENTMRRLLVEGGPAPIGREELAAALGFAGGGTAGAGMAGAGPAEAGESLSESVARHLRRYFDLHGEALPPPGLHRRILDEVETPLIEIALEATGGNQLRCAELLGLNRNTLRKKIAALGIEVTRRRRLM
ncbi:MAG: sigma-54-dependent Fis family transcriptional regulator [Alphaproteobacteria bacterium]|nr:MAG: sigma-54-dependent Fis family transcriptional regulator [Alphaproteobacteria bacterium]